MVDYARKHRVKLAQTFYLHHNTRWRKVSSACTPKW
jgi:hypothetical protein